MDPTALAAHSAFTSQYQTVFTPQAYGAVADGVTDDGPAIQAAENAASAVLGGVVFFPLGEYHCGSGLTKSVRTKWEGAGGRYVESVTDSRDSRGARIVCGFDGGDLVTISGTAGNGILQRGRIERLQFSDGGHTTSRGIVLNNDAREHFFVDVLVNGFSYGFHGAGVKALRFYEVYATDGDVGCYLEDTTDCLFFHSQFSGTTYGAHFVDCQGFTGTGNRWQVSSVNLFMDRCSYFAFVGGFNDTGTGIGLHLLDCQNGEITHAVYYANGAASSHVLIEAVTLAVSGIYVHGTFHPGATSTPNAVDFAATTPGTLAQVGIGGNFQAMSSKFTNDNVVGSFSVQPAIGTELRLSSHFYPDADNTYRLGVANKRFADIISTKLSAYKAVADTYPSIQLDGATGTILYGPGGATAPVALASDIPANPPSGYIRQTVDRGSSAMGGAAVLTSGVEALTSIYLRAGDVVTSIGFIATAAASTPTNQWFTLRSSARELLGITADDTTTAWATSSIKELNLTTAYTVPTTGWYYVGAMVAATTTPQLLRVATSSYALGLAPVVAGNDATNTGRTTPASAPATSGALTAFAHIPWAGVK